MLKKEFQPGERVIYRRTKYTPRPGPRARDISPSLHGDNYTYSVDKFWVVAGVTEDGRLLLQTRRGKMHLIKPSDPSLRRAGWLSQFIYRDRFPQLGAQEPEFARQSGGG